MKTLALRLARPRRLTVVAVGLAALVGGGGAAFATIPGGGWSGAAT